MKKYLHIIINSLLALIGLLIIIVPVYSIKTNLEDVSLMTMMSTYGALLLVQVFITTFLLFYNIIYWFVSSKNDRTLKKKNFIFASITAVVYFIIVFIPVILISIDPTSGLLSATVLNISWFIINPLILSLIFMFIVLGTHRSKTNKIIKSVILFIVIYLISIICQVVISFNIFAATSENGMIYIVLHIKETFSNVLAPLLSGSAIKDFLIIFIAGIIIIPFREKKLTKLPEAKKVQENEYKHLISDKKYQHGETAYKNRRSLKMSARKRMEIQIEKAELKNKKLRKIKRNNKNF